MMAVRVEEGKVSLWEILNRIRSGSSLSNPRILQSFIIVNNLINWIQSPTDCKSNYRMNTYFLILVHNSGSVTHKYSIKHTILYLYSATI